MPSVVIAAPRAAVFAFLADPTNRPRWQASLKSVELRDPNPPHVGQRWVDHLRGGPSFELRITELVEASVWAEQGRTGPLDAEVRLRFVDHAPSPRSPGHPATRVDVEINLAGTGVARPLASIAQVILRGLVRLDLPRIEAAMNAQRS